MTRYVLIMVVFVLPLLALAQPPAPYARQGIVTVTQPGWQFYTNLGAKEQLATGAVLQIARGGVIIGTARVIKVSLLDSIAELTPESPRALVQQGDIILVASNPVVIPPSGRLPWVEPDIDMSREEREALLLILIGVALAVID
ncbi:MAG: hypothetical protein BWY76_01194 [bacterium ADurb.Bin429]|nr:MAG: hypothetical protein BWY76_01194 [bacterium ADurb.Bin429]